MIYGSGLRVGECVGLRVKQLDLEMGVVHVIDGKGRKDRLTILPKSLKPKFQKHLQQLKSLHERDLNQGFGSKTRVLHVYLHDDFWLISYCQLCVAAKQNIT